MDFRSEYAEKHRNPKARAAEAAARPAWDEFIRLQSQPRREGLLTERGKRAAMNIFALFLFLGPAGYFVVAQLLA